MLNPDFNILAINDGFSKILLDALDKIEKTETVKQGTVIINDKVKTDTFFLIVEGIFKTVKKVN